MNADMNFGENIRKNLALVVSLCRWRLIRGREGREVWKGKETSQMKGLTTGNAKISLRYTSQHEYFETLVQCTQMNANYRLCRNVGATPTL